MTGSRIPPSEGPGIGAADFCMFCKILCCCQLMLPHTVSFCVVKDFTWCFFDSFRACLLLTAAANFQHLPTCHHLFATCACR